MHGRDPFGSLLYTFRTRLGGTRHNVGWLAKHLGHPASTIYGWENGDHSKGLPSRATILRIGRLYSLKPEEVNLLLSACGAKRKRPAQAASYGLLSEDDLQTWSILQAPSCTTIDIWRDRLRAAQEAYHAGELRSARNGAEQLLIQMPVTTDGEHGNDLWTRDELDEISHLWILAWHEFFESSALLETNISLARACGQYMVLARWVANATTDPLLKALVLHIEGDWHHIQDNYVTAMDYHLEAMHHLGTVSKNPPLAAMIQRLTILDGVHQLRPDQLVEHIRKARSMAEALEPGDTLARTLLYESTGRVLGLTGDPECWGVLADAEKEARANAPVGYITALYSRMVALLAGVRGGDTDQLRHVGAHAYIIASHSGWARRVEQVTRIAALAGIEIEKLV